MPNLIKSSITKLDLQVINLMRSYNSETAISAKSKERYLGIGTKYNNFLEQADDVVSAESIENFLDSNNLSGSTYNLYLSALIKIITEQAHFSGMNRIEIAAIKEDIKQHCKRKKLVKSVKRNAYFKKDEIFNIIAQADEKTGVMMEFLFYTGCRISEAINIKLSNVKISDDVAEIKVLGKGDKEGYVYVDSKLIEIIKNIFQGRVYLFETTKHTQYHRENIWKMFQKAGLKSGVGKNNPHKFRHSTAMHLLHNDVDKKNIRYVQKALRHSSSATTAEYYTHDEPDREIVKVFK